MTNNTNNSKGFSGYKCVEKESKWEKCSSIMGGNTMVAWLDPWTGEVMWSSTEPPVRKYTAYESVAELADWVKPMGQRSCATTTENEAGKFK